MKEDPVIIVGGGITGLSAAWYLEKRGFTNIIILEKSDRTGGKIETTVENGFLVESGPDSFIITKPYALDLVHDLGLDNELISPKTNRFLILKDGLLKSAPKGLNMMVPTDLPSFLESDFFSWPAKHRILQESVIAPNLLDGDESFARFIIRRFGEEMLDLYAGPLFTGIYATPAHELSLMATFPMLKNMEITYGSITRAIKKQMAAQPQGTAGRSTFLGLRHGMQTLPDTLVKNLKHTRIHLNTSVNSIEISRAGYTLKMDDGQIFSTGNLIITLPARAAKNVIRNISNKAAAILSDFNISSSRIVTLAYKKENISDPLLATGYVSAAGEQNYVNAGTWMSSKWEGRTPEGYELLRCFIGKSESSLSLNNDQLIQMAHREMSALLGISSEPDYYWVQRWDDALPQYKVGHLTRIEALQQALKPFNGLQLTGSYLFGVGLPDCIKQGKDAAEAVKV